MKETPVQESLNQVGSKTLTLIANVEDPAARRKLCRMWTEMSWTILEGFGYQYRDGEDKQKAIAGHIDQNIAFCERRRVEILAARITTKHRGE